MRTTLTLDDDLAAALKERARLLDQPFRQVVNDLLRRSLPPTDDGAADAEAEEDAPAEERKPYRVVPIAGGIRPEFEGMSMNKVYDQLLVEDYLQQQQRDEESLRKRSQ